MLAGYRGVLLGHIVIVRRKARDNLVKVWDGFVRISRSDHLAISASQERDWGGCFPAMLSRYPVQANARVPMRVDVYGRWSCSVSRKKLRGDEWAGSGCGL